MNRIFRSPSLISNALIILVVSSFYSLGLWSYQTRSSIENSEHYPNDILVFHPVLPPRSADLIRSDETSAWVRGHLSDTRQLGFVGGLRYDYISKKELAIFVSDSLIDLGVFQIMDEHAHEFNRVMAQYGGPYHLGDNTSFGTITAIVKPLWIRNSGLTDAALLVVDYDFESNSTNDLYTFYFHAAENDKPEEVLKYIEAYTGRAYAYQPLYEYIFSVEYWLERHQVRLQQIAVAILLLCLLLTIFSSISRAWYQQREVLRLERVLGRSRRYFIIKWFLMSVHQWFWGLCLATAGFNIYLLFKGRLLYGLSLTVLTWYFAITALGLCMTGIVSRFSSQFPLARIKADTERSNRDLIIPLGITFFLVFGVSYLFSSTLALWIGSRQVSQSLGANTLLAITTPTASQPIPDELCSVISNIPCVKLRTTTARLWDSNYRALYDDISYQGLMQLDFDYAEILNLTLVAGRFPHRGLREVAIHENLIPVLKDVNPAFALGDFLGLDYEVVGIIATPKTGEFLLSQSIYDTGLFIPLDAPQFLDRYFLAPAGQNVLVIKPDAGTSLAGLKQLLRSNYSDLEFLQPAEYARLYSQQMQHSLTRFLAIFLLLLVLTGIVYNHLTVGTLERRSLEIGIWRLLGMNITRLYLKILRPLVFTLLLAGLLATIFTCLLLEFTRQSDDILHAAVGGIVTTFLLTLKCAVIVHQKVRSIRSENIAINSSGS